MKDVLLLHGAIGSAAQLEPLANLLKPNYNVHLLHFPGHGGTPMPAQFSIPFFAQTVADFCAANRLEKVSVFGYSMGGYVGLHLARHRPALVEKLATLATKLEWSEAIAEKEVKLLQPEVLIQKLPQFASQLAQRHAPNNWKEVLAKTADMLLALGRSSDLKGEDYPAIEVPTLLMLGDRDKMVSREETMAVYKALPQAQLAVLPSTPHPLEQTDSQLLAYLLDRFFCG